MVEYKPYSLPKLLNSPFPPRFPWEGYEWYQLDEIELFECWGSGERQIYIHLNSHIFSHALNFKIKLNFKTTLKSHKRLTKNCQPYSLIHLFSVYSLKKSENEKNLISYNCQALPLVMEPCKFHQWCCVFLLLFDFSFITSSL